MDAEMLHKMSWEVVEVFDSYLSGLGVMIPCDDFSEQKEREEERKKTFEKSLREKVIQKSGELNVYNKALWEDVVNLVPISEGMDIAKLEEETKRLYESKLKAYNGEGATPYGGRASGSGHNSSKALDEFFAKKAQEGKFPAKQ